jgi:hypothetical protein
LENLNVRGYVDIVLDRRMILKWISKEIGCDGMDWIDLTQDMYVLSGSIKRIEFLH